MASEAVNKKRTRKKSKVVIKNSIPDYGNDPAFLKKAEASKIFLNKHGFPEELLKKK